MTSIKKRTSIATIAAFLSVILMAQMPAYTASVNAVTPDTITSDEEFESKLPYIPPHPEESVQQNLIQRALDVEGVKNWSASGWEPSIDWYGVSDPTPHYTKAIVQLKLAPGKGTPKYTCSENWVASVEFDLKTDQITKADFPSENNRECHKGNIELGPIKQSAEIEPQPNLIPQAAALHTFLTAQQSSVATNNRYGAFTYLSTPQIDDANIWTEMNQYVSHTLNQDFGSPTPSFLQVGYILTTVAGCTGCNISADAAQFAYVDSAYWGDYQPRKINITYNENNSAIAYIICDTGTKIKERLWSNGNFFSRDSSVDCGTKVTTDPYNNSVFFENANTNTSSTWADEIETSVKAYTAKEYTSTSSYSNWASSANKKVDCSAGKTSTTLISGSLASAGTATWSLSTMDAAC